MGAAHRPLGGPGDPAGGGGPQRTGPGHDPAPGHGLQDPREDAQLRLQAGDVDGRGHCAVLRNAAGARLPPAAPLGPLGHVGRPGLPHPALRARPGPEHQRRPDLDPPGPHVLPAGGDNQGVPGGLLRLLPHGQPRQPRPGGPEDPGRQPAPGPAPGPPADRVGREHCRPGPPARFGQLATPVRAVRRHPVRGHRPAQLAAHRRGAVHPGGLVRGHPPQPRAAARRRLAARHGPRHLQPRVRQLPAAGDGTVRHGLGRAAGHRLGQGLPQPRTLRELRLHYRLLRRGAGADGDAGAAHALPHSH